MCSLGTQEERESAGSFGSKDKIGKSGQKLEALETHAEEFRSDKVGNREPQQGLEQRTEVEGEGMGLLLSKQLLYSKFLLGAYSMFSHLIPKQPGEIHIFSVLQMGKLRLREVTFSKVIERRRM